MNEILKFKKLCKENKSVGLFGGSFDPPHKGHLKIATDAVSRFGLDQVIWLITNQNTLKERKATSFAKRFKWCEEISKDEKSISVSGIEQALKITDTIEIIKYVNKNFPNNDFYWIAGSDILTAFHKWPLYQDILGSMKFIVYNRPGFSYKENENQINEFIKNSKFENDEFKKTKKLPAWTLVEKMAVEISSTEIRSSW